MSQPYNVRPFAMQRAAFFWMPSLIRSLSMALSHSASTSSIPSCKTPLDPLAISSPAYKISTPDLRSMIRASAISSRLRMMRVTL